MRRVIWGGLIWLLLTVAAGHAAVWSQNEWPFNPNKTASHAIHTRTRQVYAPAGFAFGIGVGPLWNWLARR